MCGLVRGIVLFTEPNGQPGVDLHDDANCTDEQIGGSLPVVWLYENLLLKNQSQNHTVCLFNPTQNSGGFKIEAVDKTRSFKSPFLGSLQKKATAHSKPAHVKVVLPPKTHVRGLTTRVFWRKYRVYLEQGTRNGDPGGGSFQSPTGTKNPKCG